MGSQSLSGLCEPEDLCDPAVDTHDRPVDRAMSAYVTYLSCFASTVITEIRQRFNFALSVTGLSERDLRSNGWQSLRGHGVAHAGEAQAHDDPVRAYLAAPARSAPFRGGAVPHLTCAGDPLPTVFYP